MRPAITFQKFWLTEPLMQPMTVLALVRCVVLPGKVPAQFFSVRAAFRADRRSELVPEKQTSVAVERLSPVFNDRAISHAAEKHRPADEATDAPVFGYGKS